MDGQDGFRMRRVLFAIIVSLISAIPNVANAGDSPPPLSFDTPPLTPQQQTEMLEYRLYLSELIGSQVDLHRVHALVREGGNLLQAHSVKFKIKISPNGRLVYRRIALSCGYEPLDSLFLTTLENAAPFKSPPSFAIYQSESIDVTFAIVSPPRGENTN